MNQPAPTLEALQAAFSDVHDPEFGISIIDLGLIHEIRIDGDHVIITMTLTSFYCPAGDVITAGVKCATERVPGVGRATVNLVWEPLWTPERLTPAGRQQLGWDAPRIEA